MADIETNVWRSEWKDASGTLCLRPLTETLMTIPPFLNILLMRWCIQPMPFAPDAAFAPIVGSTYPVRLSTGVCMRMSASTLWIGIVTGRPLRYFLVFSGIF